MMSNKKLCYILPLYSTDTFFHYYHIYELLEDAAQRLDIFLFIERSDGLPAFKNIDNSNIYIQKYRKLPLRLIERFFVFIYVRMKGYKKFYIHQSHFSALIASIITKISGEKTYYWICGLNKEFNVKWKLKYHVIKKKVIDEYFFSLTLKMVDYLVTGTPLMAEYYSKNYKISMNKIKVMPNWVNLERFDPKDCDSEKIKEELGVNKDKKVVLYVHWLSERKGAQYLTKITKEIKKQVSDFILIVVGEGPYRERLEQEIEDNDLGDVIKVVGKIPNKEIQKYYAISDVFIMPSNNEGFPRVLLECMAMNVPFVATDVGGVRDIIPNDGKCFVVKKGEIEEFGARVVELLKDESPYNFRDFIEEKYEKKVVAERYIEMLF